MYSKEHGLIVGPTRVAVPKVAEKERTETERGSMKKRERLV